jgi:hypothetical protein
MAAQKKQLSLDTNFIFDLAGDKDFAHEFREIFQSKGYALVLPPTAAHELHLIFTHGDSAAERELARTALTRLLQWGIRPFDLDSTAEAIPAQEQTGLRSPKTLSTRLTCGQNLYSSRLFAGNAALSLPGS